MTFQQDISNRVVGKSISEAIQNIHSTPIYGIVEGAINGFSGMRYLPESERVVEITLKAGTTGRDIYIITPGTGITNYSFLETNMGYDTDSEEYKELQRDPDYMNKMGIGIPTIASLSIDGIAEFRSVSINTKGQEEGLVATYTVKRGRDKGWIRPAEHPDSRYVFTVEGHTVPMKTGVWLIIKNAKRYQIDKVQRILSDTLARKLNDGYHIKLRNRLDDEFIDVRPPEKFCSKHETIIGYITDEQLGRFPVYADIHRAERPEDATVNILVKKMNMDIFQSDHMAMGYIGYDHLNIKPDREGIVLDPYDPNYQQLQKLVLHEFDRLGIEKRLTEQIKNQKRSKWLNERAKHLFTRYYLKNPLDSLLEIDAMPAKDAVTGKAVGKVTRPTKRCENGLHWDNKLRTCVPILEKVPRKPPEEPETTRGPNEPHVGFVTDKTKKGKRRKISDEYTDQSIPNFRILKVSDPNRFFIWIDEKLSAIFVNYYYPWMKEVWESAQEKTIDLLVVIGIMNAVPQNRNLSPQQFLTKLAKSL
jgi:hypothetical protein